MNRLDEGRLQELIADSVTEGLGPADAAVLPLVFPEGCGECFEFERAAAAVDLALAPPAEPLPQALRDRILIGAGRYMEFVGRRDAAVRKAFN